uniref:Hematopoietic progenitor cell antigen CD34 n=1 Tax=Oryzias latipes TaxID=8090 RepID=A0A3P9M142_ORYLA
MATSMLGMNGLCRIAGALLLFALLSEVMCEDNTNSTIQGANSTQDGDTPQSGGATATPSGLPVTESQLINKTVPTLGKGTDGPVGKGSADVLAGAATTDLLPPKEVMADVKCVGKEDLHNITVKAEVQTKDCNATKKIIEENPAGWCQQESCQLTIFQDGKTIFVSSNDTKPGTLVNALQSEKLKNKLGVMKTEIQSSSRSVFVGLLVTGLLAAIALTVGYFKCQRRPAAKGARLAEEASPVDPENQGNTLASEAPLNPPPETQEKPNINGESPEAEKPQSPPPTNGHSNAKTADTEL